MHVVVTTLLQAGFEINQKKSVLQPAQHVQHLGFTLDLKKGALEISTEKLKSIRKELGKVVLAEKMSCRKMAAILGQVRSCLVALPCLRAFSDQFVKFVNLQQVHVGIIK